MPLASWSVFCPEPAVLGVSSLSLSLSPEGLWLCGTGCGRRVPGGAEMRVPAAQILAVVPRPQNRGQRFHMGSCTSQKARAAKPPGGPHPNFRRDVTTRSRRTSGTRCGFTEIQACFSALVWLLTWWPEGRQTRHLWLLGRDLSDRVPRVAVRTRWRRKVFPKTTCVRGHSTGPGQRSSHQAHRAPLCPEASSDGRQRPGPGGPRLVTRGQPREAERWAWQVSLRVDRTGACISARGGQSGAPARLRRRESRAARSLSSLGDLL